MTGMALISITNTTLIFDLNPLFCMILAFFILQERIDSLSIAFACGAFGGIYFLTLNKSNQSDDESSSALLGIFLVFLGSWFQASIMILLRMLGIYNVHYLFRPVYSSIAFLITAIVVMIILPEQISFPNYSLRD